MVIRLDHAHVSRGPQDVLKDLSLEISLSPTFILGANGSGKTTLLQCLGGLLPYKGSVRLGNKEVSSLRRKEIAEMLAFLPQVFALPSKLSVYDFVMLGRFARLPWLGQFRQEDKAAVETELKRLGITHLADREVDRISGGEFQKVLLARSLSQDTEVILMDEPTQSLDPQQQDFFEAILAELEQEGKLMIIVSHHLDLVSRRAREVIALKEGKLWFQGKAEELPKAYKQDLYLP